MNIFDVTVSSFNGYKSTSTSQCTSLYDWLTSCDYKSEVDEIRSIKDKEVRRKLKSKLPAITPAGVFSNRRKGAKPITYSGFMCIDIDEHDNEHIRNFSALKEQLKNLLNVAYCGLSVSGRGFFLLIPIAYPEKYELHYDAFVENLSKLGINVDKSCRNISRLRGYSYDSKGYFNFNADTYYDLKFPSKPQLYSHYESDTTDDVDGLIMKICSHGIDITSNYKDWFAIGCAFASEFGEEGRIRFHYISSQSSKYNENKCNKQYDNCIKWVVDKRTSIGIFFNYCKLYGVTKGMNNPD